MDVKKRIGCMLKGEQKDGEMNRQTGRRKPFKSTAFSAGIEGPDRKGHVWEHRD